MRPDLNEMRREITDLIEQSRAIIDKATAEKRTLSPEQDREYRLRWTEIAERRAALSRAELERDTEPERMPDAAAHSLFGDDAEPATRAGAGPGRNYRSLFGQPSHQAKFSGLGDFLTAVSDPRDPRLQLRGMTEGLPSGGGFLVPDEYSAEFLDIALEQSVMLSRATIWPLKAATLKVSGWDGANHGSTLFGGLAGAWLAETGTATPETPAVREIELQARKLGIYVDVSSEWLRDATQGETRLREAMAAAVAFYLDDSLIHGSGAGQPLGLLNAPCKVKVLKETGQAANTIQYENLVNMWARLLPVCQVKSIWIANPDIVPQLFTMGLTLGVGGAPVFLPAGGASGMPYSSLFGRPIVFSEKASQLGDEGDLILTDPTKYAVALAGEVRLESTNALRWLTDQVSFRCLVRADGMPMLDTAVTPKRGTNTLSSIVTLEAR